MIVVIKIPHVRTIPNSLINGRCRTNYNNIIISFAMHGKLLKFTLE